MFSLYFWEFQLFLNAILNCSLACSSNEAFSASQYRRNELMEVTIFRSSVPFPPKFLCLFLESNCDCCQILSPGAEIECESHQLRTGSASLVAPIVSTNPVSHKHCLPANVGNSWYRHKHCLPANVGNFRYRQKHCLPANVGNKVPLWKLTAELL